MGAIGPPSSKTTPTPRSYPARSRTWPLLVLGAVIATALLWTAIPIGGPASAQSTRPAKERFDSGDKDHDGKLDREEFYQLAVESFYFRDKGRKGYLVVEDLKEASPQAFKAANQKSDGRLTLQEYVNALFIDFDQADRNKDGGLTFEEIETYWKSSGR